MSTFLSLITKGILCAVTRESVPVETIDIDVTVDVVDVAVAVDDIDIEVEVCDA